MLKVASLLGGIIFSMSAIASPVCQQSWGQMICSKGTIDKLNAQGIVSVIDTKVLGKSSINGTFNAKNAQLNELSIHGMSVFNNSSITGESHLFGSLKASNCKFSKSLFITSQNMALNSCNLAKIVASSGGEFNTIIKLTGNSVVNQIVFTKAGGEVWLYDTAKVLQPVQGGTIINK